MKKYIYILFSLFIILPISSCNNALYDEINKNNSNIDSEYISDQNSITNSNHIHNISDKWTYDETYHWHEATCCPNIKENIEEHNFDGQICTICNYETTYDYKLEFVLSENSYYRLKKAELYNENATIKIPSIYKSLPVKEIESYVFTDCNVKNISIPNSITRIWSYAFFNCKKLERVVIPDSVVDIGYHTFEGCSNLSYVKLSKNISGIKYNDFYNCYILETFDIPSDSKLQYISEYAFANCLKLKNIILPESVKKLGYIVFIIVLI